VLRNVQVNASGNQVIFQALGHIYRGDINKDSKLRLTGFSDRFEGEPTWSPNSKQIVFTTWSDTRGGQIYISDLRKIRSLKLPYGHYFEPAWAPDGANIVYRKGDGNWIRGFSGTADPGIYMIQSKGGEARRITDFGSNPKFSADGERLLVMDKKAGNTALVSIDLNGLDRRVLATGKYADEIVLSPDENWLAFSERYHVYVIPFKSTGRPLELAPKLTGIPIARADVNGGAGLHWSAKGNTLYWSLGAGLYSRKMSDLFDLNGKGDAELAGPDDVPVDLGWQHTADNPRGTIALVGAKVITMDQDKVYPDGTVLIRNGKIAGVGASDNISIPSAATVINAKGKVIIPGLIDVHAHMGLTFDGLLPTQNWAYLANLAFGVTTTHDPSRDTELVFANSELQKAGYILAPRIFSTGTILYGADASFKAEVNSLDDAVEHLKRLKAYGAFSVKSYNQPRRDQRQQIIKAARDLKMMVVPEGASTLQWNLNMLLDGHTGIEHSIPVAPLYKDVISLFAATKVGYTPTLIVSYGGLWGEKYWYQHQNVFEHELLLNYTPRELLDRAGRRRMQAEDKDYNYIENARAAKVLADAGVKVNNGAHGQLEGLGVHWEMWMMVQGGMTPVQALQASTINGAEYLGLDQDLGSIKVGKLADLVILSADPLVDIHNSEMVHQVMLNGRLYDAATLNEIAPNPNVREPLWFK
ncbi:amidohydrolase family protein, partial [Candidatus Neomarinimicrobiota bacterium]